MNPNQNDDAVEATWATREGPDWPESEMVRWAAIFFAVVLISWITLTILLPNSLASNSVTEFFGILVETSAILTIVGWIIRKQEEERWMRPLRLTAYQIFNADIKILTSLEKCIDHRIKHRNHMNESDHRRAINLGISLYQEFKYLGLIQERFSSVLYMNSEMNVHLLERLRLNDRINPLWHRSFSNKKSEIDKYYENALQETQIGLEVIYPLIERLKVYLKGSEEVSNAELEEFDQKIVTLRRKILEAQSPSN